jgi:Ca2+-binding RTX toxin-like protein
MWLRRGVVLIAGVAMALFATSAARATFQPELYYKPPLIRVFDNVQHLSVEDVLIRRSGNLFGFENLSGSPFLIDPASDPGCVGSSVSTCPVAGVERMKVFLGPMDDSLDINLGRSADRVQQSAAGGPDADEMTGARGRQRFAGGPGNDTLRGGTGKDVLIGGTGDDTCRGGPGKDIVKSCE